MERQHLADVAVKRDSLLLLGEEELNGQLLVMKRKLPQKTDEKENARMVN